VVVPVVRATSASAIVDTRPADVSVLAGDSEIDRSPAIYSLSVEVVWASSDPAPSATGFASVFGGDTSELRPLLPRSLLQRGSD
jgi:hypothetical protein